MCFKWLRNQKKKAILLFKLYSVFEENIGHQRWNLNINFRLLDLILSKVRSLKFDFVFRLRRIQTEHSSENETALYFDKVEIKPGCLPNIKRRFTVCSFRRSRIHRKCRVCCLPRSARFALSTKSFPVVELRSTRGSLRVFDEVEK